MLTEEALLQIIIALVQYGVYPCDMIVWLFYPLASFGIVKHYLTRADFILVIRLPEYSCTVPILGCTNLVSLHEL